MPGLTYNGNIPQATDAISASQNPIKLNFGSIQTLIDVNHVDFNNANYGKHNFSTYVRQPADYITVGTDVAIYSKLNAATNDSELYFATQAAGPILPWTGGNLVTAGWSYIAPGLQMKWGIVSPNFPDPNNVYFINLAGYGPAITNVFNIQLTMYDAPNTSTPITVSAVPATYLPTGFYIQFKGNNPPTRVFWMVIGA